MKNIICPNCKGELLISSALRSHEIEEEELIPVIEKALCENCKRVFDVHFGVSEVIDVGSQDDFYLYRDDEEEESEDNYEDESGQLGDMYLEKDGYILTHKEFATMEDLEEYIELYCNEETDCAGDIIQVITVEKDDYMVCFELVEDADATCLISLYTNDSRGALIYKSNEVNLKHYDTIEDIEKKCVVMLDQFIQQFEDEKEEENESDNNTFKKIEIKCTICGGELSYSEAVYSDIDNGSVYLEDLICENCGKSFEVEYLAVAITETGNIEVEDDKEELED